MMPLAATVLGAVSLVAFLTALGGTEAWAQATDPVRVHAVLVADRQGRGAADATPEQIARSLAHASRTFAPAGLE